MAERGVFGWPGTWPDAADGDAAGRLIERFAAIGAAEARLVRHPHGAAALAAIGGNSPYLSDLVLREPRVLRATVLRGPDAVVARALAGLRADRTSGPGVAAAARRAKRIVALATALADIGGAWRLARVTGALSDLAEAALRLALAACAADLGLDPGAPGFVVLGMGKLGARELNYSSDIDLILLYDPDRFAAGDAGSGADLSTRLARALVTMMERRDADGYVFRVDLRLRPDPAATPPAISLPAAISYYESIGQNWERAAMLKARPVAGDLALGEMFLDAIRPFIWRRGLDFAAITDLRAMRRRIEARGARGGLPGFDLKLGPGGIRDVEFLAQTLQLVWGGRDPRLRERRTEDAIRALVRVGRLPPRAGGELLSAYRFLRRVEHRLQMVADRQTHTLPGTGDGLARFAVFAGDPGLPERLARHLGRVHARAAEVFGDMPLPEEPDGLDFRGDQDSPETLERLRAFGFAAPARVSAAVRAWQAGRPRALRSARARDILGHLLPALLAALARQRQPDAAFARFDSLLGRLPAGVQLLALLDRNPGLLETLAAVLGATPSLADHLAADPGSIEGLLLGGLSEQPAALIAAQLADARDVGDAIAIVRRAVRAEDFAISVATLLGELDADAAGRARADLADAALGALLPVILDDYAERNGVVPGGGMALVLLGKAGGRAMMAGSDLDLMLIYDHPPEAAASINASTGARPVAPSQWYARAAQAVVAGITAPGPDGPMYEVDMRLRPSGGKGPVAVSLAAFTRYHAESAWTWERMALTRARVVAGAPALTPRARDAITAALHHSVPAATVLSDAAAMRARLGRERPGRGPWDVKHRAGGLIDVEFIAQALGLIHGASAPGTGEALAALDRQGVLDEQTACFLAEADRLWRTVQGMLRIAVGREPPDAIPPAFVRPLLRAASRAEARAADLDQLQATMDETARRVRALFETLIGPVAGRA